jgi:hypothetical protein
MLFVLDETIQCLASVEKGSEFGGINNQRLPCFMDDAASIKSTNGMMMMSYRLIRSSKKMCTPKVN